jgi:hypothetical protein
MIGKDKIFRYRMNNSENTLDEKICGKYFEKMFDNIWEQKSLENILFLNNYKLSESYKHFVERNKEGTDLEFLAGYFGNCLWGIFSNNHSVVTQNGIEFDIGSWRGAGGFIADFINKHINKNCFDYMDFYMGHFGIFDNADAETKTGYQFIFSKLKEYDFDWQYEYPGMRIINSPTPAIIIAYANVFGKYPNGWID